eukprot:4611434-Karenia_brevis.AAC.1
MPTEAMQIHLKTMYQTKGRCEIYLQFLLTKTSKEIDNLALHECTHEYKITLLPADVFTI